MTRHNQHPDNNSGERLTQERYRIDIAGLNYQDYIHQHPAGVLRFVAYDRGNDLEEQSKKRLAQNGLILGSEIPSSPDDDVSYDVSSYKIPTSSRPIGYDVGSGITFSDGRGGNAQHKYTDEMLFTDVASLLGEVANVRRHTQIGYVHRLGQLLIATEFTDPGVRPLYLAPGIERVLRPTDNGASAIAVSYRERMHEEFGERFEPFATTFENKFLTITK